MFIINTFGTGGVLGSYDAVPVRILPPKKNEYSYLVQDTSVMIYMHVLLGP